MCTRTVAADVLRYIDDGVPYHCWPKPHQRAWAATCEHDPAIPVPGELGIPGPGQVPALPKAGQRALQEGAEIISAGCRLAQRPAPG